MNCKRIGADLAADFLLQHDKVVILTHANPDGDTIGSAFALNTTLRDLGKQSKVVCGDEFPKKFSYLTADAEAEFEPLTVVAVDIADEKLLGSLKEQYGGKIQLCIDHHATNTGFSELLYLEGDSAAACECVYNVINEMGVEITPFIASCLYTGLATDTGCFKFSNTTERTHRYAAELMKAGADFDEINRVLFEVKSRGRLAMEKLVLQNIEFYCEGKCALITVTQDMIKQTGCDSGDIDGITAISRQIEGVLIGITVREKADGRYKVSLRTFEPYDAAAICAELGGGGHIRAAGCEFGCGLQEVKALVTDRVCRYLSKE